MPLLKHLQSLQSQVKICALLVARQGVLVVVKRRRCSLELVVALLHGVLVFGGVMIYLEVVRVEDLDGPIESLDLLVGVFLHRS